MTHPQTEIDRLAALAYRHFNSGAKWGVLDENNKTFWRRVTKALLAAQNGEPAQ